MKYLRYTGKFISISGVIWRADILQEADSEFTTIGQLVFDADQPLVIEWGNKSKEEVICGAVATLKIISPGDRTYEDLYSVEVGRIVLNVYRNTTLYWSGTIDTEFYEEPYEQAKGYTVTLTFSDFGVMDRLKYDRAGMLSLEDVVSYCIGRCGIEYGGIDCSLISTQLSAQFATAMSLASLKVRSDNFYDEDGEASTLAEVVEGVLQPLGLRMVQRCGKVYVYDLNGLYNKATTKQITWSGSSQTMGVDVVYNNAKITWNTYAQAGNLLPEKCWLDSIETPKDSIAINNATGVSTENARYFSYHYSTNLYDWIDATDSGFTIWLSKQGKNATINSAVNFFRIVPQYDGNDCEGIAIRTTAFEGFKVGDKHNWTAQLRKSGYGLPTASLVGFLTDIGITLFKSSEVWLPPVDNSRDLMLRISLEMLLDPRFNPFESAANIMKYEEEKDWYNMWNSRGNFMYVPVLIKFKPDGSDTVYVWDNRELVKQSVDYPITTLTATYGQWYVYQEDGSGKPNRWGWLAWYDAKDRNETSGVLGWKTNRPAINPHKSNTVSVLTNAEAGQYIPYPEAGAGTFWIEICGGTWQLCDGGHSLENVNYNNPKGLWEKYNWIMFKLPKVEIMNNTQFEQAINADDVEYNGELNTAAKESIDIDTICGTSAEGVPTARGAYFNAQNGKQIRNLTRAGRTAQAEELLIGTLYSQFAKRRTTLSGEAELMHDPIATYSEQNQQDKKFMVTEDVQDVRMDCSDATYVELRPDEYDKQN